jgi:F420-dependent oxidoreductase-like protein
VRIALMIEGQEDVSWDDWIALAEACERHGFEALFRSDHYISVGDFRERGSLDAWGTVTALAARTTTLRLGTLVSPATFRHPSVLAKLAVTADHVSGGRVELGIGTGWWETEHAAYGFPFPPLRTRMDVLAEQLEIIHRQWQDEPFSFHGAHYTLEDLDARPKPVQEPHPPLIMGGVAQKRSAALAARWADEYNTVFPDVATAKERHDKVMAACEAIGRDPGTMGFSMMNGLLIGADEAELRARADALAEWRREPTDLEALRGTWVVGTTDQVIERLREYEAAGVQRVMLQHLLHRDLDVIELLGEAVIPAVAG